MISEYYVNEGAKVTGTDLSPECIERAKIRSQKYGFFAEFQVADSENLLFPDSSVDIVSVHDGLHHLDDPRRTVKEIARVARRGIVIIEPAKALITRISVLLGISKEYEGKDFVYRFRRDELITWLKEAGIKKIIIRRYAMYYSHQPGKSLRIFDNELLFYIIKRLFELLNMLLGRFGNKIQVVGLK